jgi:hypothetical protein
LENPSNPSSSNQEKKQSKQSIFQAEAQPWISMHRGRGLRTLSPTQDSFAGSVDNGSQLRCGFYCWILLWWWFSQQNYGGFHGANFSFLRAFAVKVL